MNFQWKVFASGEKDLHIGRSVLPIDYLIKTVEFLYEIGSRYHSDLKWQYKWATSGSHEMGEEKKQSHLGLQTLGWIPAVLIFFFLTNSLYVLGQNTLKLIGLVSISVKWGYIIYYLPYILLCKRTHMFLAQTFREKIFHFSFLIQFKKFNKIDYRVPGYYFVYRYHYCFLDLHF